MIFSYLDLLTGCNIFSFLNVQFLLHCRRVNKQWHKVSNHTTSWKNVTVNLNQLNAVQDILSDNNESKRKSDLFIEPNLRAEDLLTIKSALRLTQRLFLKCDYINFVNAEIYEFLKFCAPQIRHIELSCAACEKQVVEILRNCPKLECIEFAEYIDYWDARLKIFELPVFETVKQLGIGWHQITDEEATEICTVFPNLTVLKFCNRTNFTKNGISILAKGLQDLHTLHLWSNINSNDELMKSFSEFKQLSYLKLAHWDSLGYTQLYLSSSLKKLNLTYMNNCGLSEIIKSNQINEIPLLEELVLDGVFLVDELLSLLVHIAQKLKRLELIVHCSTSHDSTLTCFPNTLSCIEQLNEVHQTIKMQIKNSLLQQALLNDLRTVLKLKNLTSLIIPNIHCTPHTPHGVYMPDSSLISFVQNLNSSNLNSNNLNSSNLNSGNLKFIQVNSASKIL